MTRLQCAVKCCAALLLAALVCASPASAQSPPSLSCEQQAVILDQLVSDVSARRHSIEIEAAALRVRVKQLEADLKAAAHKATATPPAPVGAPPQFGEQ